VAATHKPLHQIIGYLEVDWLDKALRLHRSQLNRERQAMNSCRHISDERQRIDNALKKLHVLLVMTNTGATVIQAEQSYVTVTVEILYIIKLSSLLYCLCVARKNIIADTHLIIVGVRGVPGETGGVNRHIA